MFCRNCGIAAEEQDNFCASCGSKINKGSDLENSAKPKPQIDAISTFDYVDVLNQATTVLQEYKGKKNLEKPLHSFLNTGFAKERISEAWSQKAIARFEGSAKDTSILPREICFAEETVLFITANSLLARGSATALRKNEIQYIEVSGFESNLKFGMAQSSERFWRLTFVTKWAGINAGIPKGMIMAASDPVWNFKEGEVSFFLPLGKTDFQLKAFEEMYMSKFDVISAFYPVRYSDVVVTKTRSVGLFVGTGFWREIGE